MESNTEFDYAYIMDSLKVPFEIAQKEGLELEFLAALCINLIRGEKDINVAANDALCEWDM